MSIEVFLKVSLGNEWLDLQSYLAWKKEKKKQSHSYFEKLNLPALKQNRFITQWGLISCWVLLNILALKIHVELETMKCTKGDHRAGRKKKATIAGDANVKSRAC